MLILAALLAVYFVFGMLYENFIAPVEDTFGMPLDRIGIIMLIGIAQDGIMMDCFAREAEGHGKSPLDVIQHACLARFRPIVMIMSCVILGGIR